ncbi:hypothetical protein HF675_04960 [Serratia sp. JUb9]|uniref:hypothetical protein n=1 Tax=Serratia sp. JUb9 TaxID=2724469 RepID=UPI00164DC2A3|nr:hypothetical protein [Serratia sp. JUb9]QNK33410.1 hypothetical protein HF675_04960 [Serratia sp. JUb9]
MNSSINPLPNGKHPTNRELQLMRLGYAEYQPRLMSIQKNNPERYSAVMDGRKRFYQHGWACPTCGNSERYTRNLACVYCAGQRIPLCFKIIEGVGSVYTPLSEERSEAYQARRQELLYQRDLRSRIRKLGEIRCGWWAFRDGDFIGQNLAGVAVVISLHEPDSFTVRNLRKQDPAFNAIWEHVHTKVRLNPEAIYEPE